MKLLNGKDTLEHDLDFLFVPQVRQPCTESFLFFVCVTLSKEFISYDLFMTVLWQYPVEFAWLQSKAEIKPLVCQCSHFSKITLFFNCLLIWFV